MHNKSPAGGTIRGQADGPELELDAGEPVSFLVRACVDGDADSFAHAALNAEVRTGTPPTADSAAWVTIRRSEHNRPLVTEVPFEDTFDLDFVSCDPGVIVSFERNDAGKGGSSVVTWDIAAFVDYIEVGADDDSEVTVLIDPMP